MPATDCRHYCTVGVGRSYSRPVTTQFTMPECVTLLFILVLSGVTAGWLLPDVIPEIHAIANPSNYPMSYPIYCGVNLPNRYSRRAEGLWHMRRHGPVIAQCTDSVVFPRPTPPTWTWSFRFSLSPTAAFYSLPHPSGPNKTVLLLYNSDNLSCL